MGRTNPTYRDALRALEREWQPMGRALRRPYRADFDRLFERARGFADAAGHANPPDPERALVVSLLLAHEAELRQLRERLDASTSTDDDVARSDDDTIGSNSSSFGSNRSDSESDDDTIGSDDTRSTGEKP